MQQVAGHASFELPPSGCASSGLGAEAKVWALFRLSSYSR